MHERESLIGRIRQIRRVSKPPDDATKRSSADPRQGRVHVLESRIEHVALRRTLSDDARSRGL